jgi:hypothetical protein
MPQEVVFPVKLESDLRDAFATKAAATHQPASQPASPIRRGSSSNAGGRGDLPTGFAPAYKEAADDPRPGIPRDVKMG